MALGAKIMCGMARTSATVYKTYAPGRYFSDARYCLRSILRTSLNARHHIGELAYTAESAWLS